MTENERKEMKESRRRRYRQRLEAIQVELGIAPWSEREWHQLLLRLDFIVGEGLTEADLRVTVRLYNREVLGRRRAQ